MELKKENTSNELQVDEVEVDINNSLLDVINATQGHVALNNNVIFILENAMKTASYKPDNL